MKFFNKIGINNYYDKSFFDKIKLLFKNEVFHIEEGDIEDFNESLGLINFSILKETEHEKEIINIFQLKFNQKIVEEIGEVVISNIIESSFPKTHIGYDVMDEYNLEIMTAINPKMKEELITSYLKKTVISLSEFCFFETPFSFNIDENFNKEKLCFIIEAFYNNIESFCEIDDTPILELKEDVITHVTPPSYDPDIMMYRTAINFMVINDYLFVIEFLKKELIKEQHLQMTIKGAYGSNYSIENVLNKDNRFPLVFKNAYTCELFLYSLSFILNPKPIIFSYYFEIFKRFHYFKKNIQISAYLAFINNVYGLKEIRVREKELSSKQDGFHVNQLINREKEFKAKTLVK